MRALLTGATGFVGREVLRHLIKRHDSIRVIVRPDTLGQVETLPQFRARKGIEVIAADLRDAEALIRAHKGLDIVYHLGWHSKRRDAGIGKAASTNPALVNQQAAEAIVKGCAENNVRRLVFTSSVAVYGPSSDRSAWPITEEALLARNFCAGEYARNYIQPKIFVEDTIRRVAKESGFQYVILRPSIVYGPGWHGADKLIQRARISNKISGALRHFAPLLQLVHVQDVARACVLAGTRPEADCREFNIAGREAFTLEEISDMIRRLLQASFTGLPTYTRYLGWPAQQRLRYDISKAKMFLGFTAQIPLVEGMASTISRKTRDDSTTKPKLGRQATAIGKVYDERLHSDLIDEYYGYSDFWNWGYWDINTSSQMEACENLVEKLLQFISTKQGTILDVACGKGATARYLLRYYRSKDIMGINITNKQIDVCRRNAPGCKFMLMDATRLNFPNGEFDNIICVEAAGHFDTREKFLREALRVLRPGGKLLLSDAIFSPRLWMSPEHRAVVAANYLQDAGEYRRCCMNVGFSNVLVEDTSVESWEGFSDNFERYLEDKLIAGEVDANIFSAMMRWRDRLASCFEFYVVAACTK